MRMTGDGGGGRQTYRYRCSGAMHGSASPSLGCTFTAIGPPVEMALRAEVSHLVDTVATRDATMEAALRRAWANLQARVDDGDVPRRIRQLEMDGERARERLKRAALLFVDGMLDQAGYELAREQAEADVGATEAELGRLGALQQKPALPSIDLVLRDAPGWREILERNDLDAQRDLLAKVVEHIVPERVRVGHYRVRIAWTPTGELLRQLAVTAERVPAA